MTAALFLAFLAATAAAVVAVVARYLGGAVALAVALGLTVWLGYVGLVSRSGVVANVATTPPGPIFLFAPVAAFLVFVVARPSATERAARDVPVWVLLGAQVFRVVVELFIHRLWVDGLAPKTLTYAGANVDIYVGATAPVVAWLAARGRAGERVALVWNVLGLLALANVVTRAILTAPGPLGLVRAEVPNLMIGAFPFTFIPGFFVPLAVVLHVLAIRALGRRLRGAA